MEKKHGDTLMAVRTLGQGLVTPTDDEARTALATGRTLAAHVGAGGLKLAVANGDAGEELELPAPAVRLLMDILTELGQGNAVALDTVQPELTTQQAADLLSVSRPYLVKLLDDGVLPSRKVNTHRRVLREDVLAYKQDIDAKRLQTLDELTALGQELGLYDDPLK